MRKGYLPSLGLGVCFVLLSGCRGGTASARSPVEGPKLKSLLSEADSLTIAEAYAPSAVNGDAIPDDVDGRYGVRTVWEPGWATFTPVVVTDAKTKQKDKGVRIVVASKRWTIGDKSEGGAPRIAILDEDEVRDLLHSIGFMQTEQQRLVAAKTDHDVLVSFHTKDGLSLQLEYHNGKPRLYLATAAPSEDEGYFELDANHAGQVAKALGDSLGVLDSH